MQNISLNDYFSTIVKSFFNILIEHKNRIEILETENKYLKNESTGNRKLIPQIENIQLETIKLKNADTELKNELQNLSKINTECLEEKAIIDKKEKDCKKQVEQQKGVFEEEVLTLNETNKKYLSDNRNLLINNKKQNKKLIDCENQKKIQIDEANKTLESQRELYQKKEQDRVKNEIIEEAKKSEEEEKILLLYNDFVWNGDLNNINDASLLILKFISL